MLGRYNKWNGYVEIKVGLMVFCFVFVLVFFYYYFVFNIFLLLYDFVLEWFYKCIMVLFNEDGYELVDFFNWYVYVMYFFDLVGNIVEFIVRRDLLNGDVIIFSFDFIWLVSEIGFLVDDVVAVFVKLEIGVGIFFYFGDNKIFNVMGNLEGLFIIVDRKEKIWYFIGK